MKLLLRTHVGGRRWLLLLALAGLGLLGWWLAYGRKPATDPTWRRIQEEGELRVALDPSWVPFEFLAPLSGELVGFDVDVARALATRLAAQFSPPREVRVEWVLTGFDGLYDVLLSGQADLVISALPFEPERVEDVGYSIAYFNAGLVLVVPDGDPDTETVRDLRGRVVAVEWAYVPEGDSRRRLRDGDLRLVRYEDAWAALEAVESGAAQAALVDAVTALQYTGQCPGLRIADDVVTDVNYVIASRPTDVRLRQAVDEVLLAMRRDGTLRRLREKWF
jgi:ABC-type amino acid transport substrate-binding protein